MKPITILTTGYYVCRCRCARPVDTVFLYHGKGDKYFKNFCPEVATYTELGAVFQLIGAFRLAERHRLIFLTSGFTLVSGAYSLG